jgi:hypothetical protein
MANRRARSRRLPQLAVAVLAVVFVVGLVGVGGVLAVRTLHSGRSATVPAFVPPPPLLAGAPTLQPAAPVPAASVPPLGYDVSHPQCKKTLPKDGGFAIVGITGGHPFSSNKCVGEQLRWAGTKSGRAVYVNSGYPGSGDPVAYGISVADDAVQREHAQAGHGTAMWWLDVELANTWAGTTQQNATVLDAMASRLQQLGVRVGIYSTPGMWTDIAGDWNPGLPIWYATGPGTAATAATACGHGFAGSTAAVVQWVEKTAQGELDHNMVCPLYRNRAGELLDLT